MRDIQLFIGGEFRNSSEGKTYKTLDKANGEEIATVHLPSIKDIDDAINAAKDAFYTSEWSEYTAEKRSEILLKISELIKERKRELIELEVKDSGSTLRKAKADIHNAASFFKVMSKTAAKLNTFKMDERASREGFSKNYRQYVPVGVCAQIIPWNFPLVMAAWKLGPILATGCTTVLKTASETPVTAFVLAEILKDAGVPAGVVNIITGDAKEGEYLTNHKDIKKIAFTGSTAVGKKIMQNASASIKNLSLELGGKSANIVLADADLDSSVDGALYAFLYHQGQACDSGTRLLVDASIYEEFTKKLIERASKVTIGVPSDIASGFGPVINEKQYNTIMNYIEKTQSEGAKLLYGGKRVTGGEFDKGYYIEPTFFEITPDNTIFHEEIFGPVLGITKFENEAQAIELANNSTYGLAGAVWSKDHDKAMKLSKKLAAGTVWINEYHLLNPGMPFGGLGESGIGREMGEEGIFSYLEVKHIWESDCDSREQKQWFDALF